MTVEIKTTAKKVTSLKELVDPFTLKRRIGLVYYQELSDGGLVARTLTEQSSKDMLKQLILNQKLYIPTQIIIAETK